MQGEFARRHFWGDAPGYDELGLRPRTAARLSVLCLAVLGLGWCLSGAAAQQPEVAILSDGQQVPGRLRSVTPDGQFVLTHQGQTRQVAASDLIVWGACRERTNTSWIVLRDGSLLTGDWERLEQGQVTWVSRLWSQLQLPQPLVRGIILRPPLDTARRDALLDRVLRETRQQDVLLLEDGDQWRGAVPGSITPPPGALYPDAIRWPVPGADEPIDIALARVTAILFAGAAADPTAPPALWVGLEDGSRLCATRLDRQDKGVRLVLGSGTELTLGATGVASEPWEGVVFLQPLGYGTRYLSDLQPLGYKHIAYLAATWPYASDHSVSGRSLRAGDALVLKGLGMHSSSRLAFDLPGSYHTLQAELALDQSAGRNGSVIYRVFLQSPNGQWAKAFESSIVRGGQPPVPLRVELGTAVRVALIVDFADRADQWDHANWLNARLTR